MNPKRIGHCGNELSALLTLSVKFVLTCLDAMIYLTN